MTRIEAALGRLEGLIQDSEVPASQLEFVRAIRAYEQQSGQSHLTWDEVQKVAKDQRFENPDERKASLG